MQKRLMIEASSISAGLDKFILEIVFLFNMFNIYYIRPAPPPDIPDIEIDIFHQRRLNKNKLYLTTENNHLNFTSLCNNNRKAMLLADGVRCWYENSTQVIIDVGMACAAGKPFFIVNDSYFRGNSGSLSSLEYFIKFMAGNLNAFGNMKENEIYQKEQKIKNSKSVHFSHKGLSPEMLFEFGMAFMLEKPYVALNCLEKENSLLNPEELYSLLQSNLKKAIHM